MTRRRSWLRLAALSGWAALLGAFWWGVRGSDLGPLAYLLTGVERVASQPWAAAGVLVAYLVRPVLLVPITLVNLASGFVLGLTPGLVLATVGTLASASIGYGFGRLLGLRGRGGAPPPTGRLAAALRRRGFESVVAGGLMYLHADAVNLPAGYLRIRYPVFLAGILVGNALTMTSAVLAGASVDGRLVDARVTADTTTLGLAFALFVVSLGLATLLRRHRTCESRERDAAR